MSRTKPAKRVHPGPEGAELLRYLGGRQEAMIGVIRRLVEQESPSFDKAAVDRLGDLLAAEFTRAGSRVRMHRARHFGDHLQADFPGARGRPVLLLGHFDTVWELGTLASMPFRAGGGRLWGPGVLDMKAGIAQMLFAIEALRELRGALPCAVTVLLVSDEEVGSESSRAITERLGKRSAAVLVLEPSAGLAGALKTARKGVGNYTLKVAGRASHAGLNPENGASAVLELARQVLEIVEFTDPKRGITVNPGIVRGGTRTNVVAAEAEAEVDARVARMSDAKRLDRRFRALRPFNPGCRLEVKGGINRPPLERTRQVAALFALARKAGAELGLELQEASVGGGSDGNFTAALGIPTLDGLGAVGEGAHATNESVLVSELPRRTALLARLIEKIAAGG
jgi:glutamate carboxypeptidase